MLLYAAFWTNEKPNVIAFFGCCYACYHINIFQGWRTNFIKRSPMTGCVMGDAVQLFKSGDYL
jgi:hypothetical protein